MATEPTYPFTDSKTIKSRFNAFQAANSQSIDRAIEQARWTLPRMFSDNMGFPNSYPSEVPELYSGKAARCIRQLAGKLGNAIFPPNGIPFFSLDPPEDTEQFGDRLNDYLDSLTKITNYVAGRLEQSNYRDVLYQSLEHLEVPGDVLIYQNDDDRFTLYRCDQYVVRKGADGVDREIITRDWLETDLLDDELKQLNKGKPTDQYGSRWEPLYTKLTWDKKGDKWEVEREFRDTVYEKDVSYKILPYYHLSAQIIYGESLGRSITEENFGDIRSLEMLSAAEIDGAAALSNVKGWIDPTGLTEIRDLKDKRPYEFAAAREQDFGFKSAAREIGPHLGALAAMIERREQALDDAYFVNVATQLTGERVTATQVVAGMQEIDDAMGGLLTNIAKQLQRPVVLRTIQNGIKRGDLDKSILDILDNNLASLEVKTGLDALGRQADTARIRSVMNDVVPLAQINPGVLDVINDENMVRELFRLSGLNPEVYTRNSEQVEQIRASRQEQALLAQGAQQAIQTTGAVIEQQARQQ